MVNSVNKLILFFGFVALLGNGCSKEAAQPQPESQPAPVAEEVTMGRSMPDAGGVERVVVQATAKGPTTQVAVDKAIRLAFEQVNGKSFDAATIGVDAGFKGQIGDSSIEASSSAYADVVVTQTQGAVKDFRILSQEELENGVEVRIEASVEKFTQPESASQLRVAIAPLRTDTSSFSIGGKSVGSADVARKISDDISQALLKSKRVTMLDREFDAEIQKELGRIDAANWQNNDRLRLGQQLAADFLVVGRLDRFEYTKHTRTLRTSDKEIISYSGGASLELRVVNVATGQVQVAETFKIELPETKPSSMASSVNTSEVVAKLVQGLSDSAAQQVTLSLFPITIVDVDGDDVVLSQGGKAVEEGQVYEVVLRGKEISDPQTGNVIGRIEKPCCQVLVTTVTAEMSYGIVQNKRVSDVAAVFAPGALELRGKVERPRTVAVERSSEPTVAKARVDQASPAQAAEPEAEEDPNW